MNKKKIGIIFGGCSSEYKVSLESAYSVIANIDKAKYDIVLIGITKEGNWFKYNGDIKNIKTDTWYQKDTCTKACISCSKSDKGLIEFQENKTNLIKLDAILPILHGKNGEDGTVQGLAELAGIPLIGCGILSSSLCMDKYLSHKLVKSYGIKVAKSIVINEKTTKKKLDTELNKLLYPLFVKPMRAGSSLGITKVEERKEIEKAIAEAFKYDTEIIIEENIEGIEVGCAILGNEKLTIGEVDEIQVSEGFLDYKEKYTKKTYAQIICPAQLDINTKNRIKQTAQKIYKILKCKDFARVDMFLGEDGEIYFNEINSIPGFTSGSRYPNMMKEININFSELIDKLISLEV